MVSFAIHRLLRNSQQSRSKISPVADRYTALQNRDGQLQQPDSLLYRYTIASPRPYLASRRIEYRACTECRVLLVEFDFTRLSLANGSELQSGRPHSSFRTFKAAADRVCCFCSRLLEEILEFARSKALSWSNVEDTLVSGHFSPLMKLEVHKSDGKDGDSATI